MEISVGMPGYLVKIWKEWFTSAAQAWNILGAVTVICHSASGIAL